MATGSRKRAPGRRRTPRPARAPRASSAAGDAGHAERDRDDGDDALTPVEPEIDAARDVDLDAATETEDAALDVGAGDSRTPPRAHRGASAELDLGTAMPQVPAPPGDERESDSALVAFDPLQRYLAEIRRYPLLTREEEHDLAVKFQQDHDVAAAYRLVTGNLRLVVMIAREYQRSFRALLDLIQEGNIGLMEAVKNFDPYRGVRFPSYAVWWIRAYVIRYVMNNWRLVKLGTTQAQRKLFFNLQKEKDKLEREGFVAGPKLLAQRLDVKEKEVIEMEQRLGASDLSVDMPLHDGEESTLLDVLKSGAATAEDQVADAEFRQRLGAAIREFGATLRDKDRLIFDQRLVAEEPLTLQEIGDKYGISRERVRQLESRIKRRLKEYLETQFEDLGDVTFS